MPLFENGLKGVAPFLFSSYGYESCVEGAGKKEKSLQCQTPHPLSQAFDTWTSIKTDGMQGSTERSGCRRRDVLLLVVFIDFDFHSAGEEVNLSVHVLVLAIHLFVSSSTPSSTLGFNFGIHFIVNFSPDLFFDFIDSDFGLCPSGFGFHATVRLFFESDLCDLELFSQTSDFCQCSFQILHDA
ncbi:hypothetical protein AC579_962 [Pseudocercospora musae]|uniref:Uncharacterized protein n=1 Tax=Pseudocercospora musae TaxID=113226 RepID=A0A139IUQ1_9PEZI|nr:hypothetical protein AC579_962 [Pseudocercospora musae]